MAITRNGYNLDMNALVKENEHTIALSGGGISMNARGDILGPGGKIVKKAEQVQSEISTLPNSPSHKISLADTTKFKKLFASQSNMSEDEQRAVLQAKIIEDKNKANSLASSIIENVPSSVPVDHEIEPSEIKMKPKQRKVINTEE